MSFVTLNFKLGTFCPLLAGKQKRECILVWNVFSIEAYRPMGHYGLQINERPGLLVIASSWDFQ
eukprot:c2619_g1_i1 orf=70-261(+)